jgi:hypothetical protein
VSWHPLQNPSNTELGFSVTKERVIGNKKNWALVTEERLDRSAPGRTNNQPPVPLVTNNQFHRLPATSSSTS